MLSISLHQRQYRKSIYFQHRPLGSLPSPLEVEARSIYVAIQWMATGIYSNIIIEINCNQLVDIINNRNYQNNEARDVIPQCVDKLSLFQNWYVQFVRLKANLVVHTLVRASRFFACQQIFYYIPSCMEAVYFGDLI